MSWQSVEIIIDANREDAISDLLFELGALSVTTSAADETQIFEIDGHTEQAWQSIKLTALFDQSTNLQPIAQQLQQHVSGPVELAEFEDQNWEKAWHKNFTQLKINNKLWICPSWLEPVDATAINVRIDPGMSFGTGTHESTRLCLDWLCELELKEKSVIDYGCGSGILAIAAVKLGASQALASDIEHRSLAASLENAKINQVDQYLNVYLPEQFPQVQCDVVVANILAGTIIELADTLTNYTCANGQILLAGILKSQEQEVKDSFVGFNWQSRYLDDWVALLGQR